MKKYILALLTLIAISATQSTIFAKENQDKLTPDNTVIAWDLRDVLLTRNRKSIPKIAWDILSNANNKWELAKLIPNIAFWNRARELTYRPDFVMDEIVDKLAEEFPALAPHKDKIFDIMTEHLPIEENIQILKEVKEAQYPNCLASNIGKRTYKILSKKKQIKLFNLFDSAYVAQEVNEEGKIIAKPMPAFLQGLHDYLKKEKGIDENTTILLIDDKQQNIDSLDKLNLNIRGIKVDSSKQLRNELIKLGVLAAKTQETS